MKNLCWSSRVEWLRSRPGPSEAPRPREAPVGSEGFGGTKGPPLPEAVDGQGLEGRFTTPPHSGVADAAAARSRSRSAEASATRGSEQEPFSIPSLPRPPVGSVHRGVSQLSQFQAQKPLEAQQALHHLGALSWSVGGAAFRFRPVEGATTLHVVQRR